MQHLNLALSSSHFNKASAAISFRANRTAANMHLRMCRVQFAAGFTRFLPATRGIPRDERSGQRSDERTDGRTNERTDGHTRKRPAAKWRRQSHTNRDTTADISSYRGEDGSPLALHSPRPNLFLYLLLRDVWP